MGQAWEQGGKDESDRWGVSGLADLPSPRGDLWGMEPKETSAHLAPAITGGAGVGGQTPLIPVQLNG